MDKGKFDLLFDELEKGKLYMCSEMELCGICMFIKYQICSSEYSPFQWYNLYFLSREGIVALSFTTEFPKKVFKRIFV